MNQGSQRGAINIVLIFAILFAILVMMTAIKIGPAYIDHWTIEEALQGVTTEVSTQKKTSKKKIMSLLDRRLSVNRIDFIEPENLIYEKQSSKVLLTLDYERRIPFMFNIDLVLKFPAKQYEANLSSG